MIYRFCLLLTCLTTIQDKHNSEIEVAKKDVESYYRL